jgi:hypothetical protein
MDSKIERQILTDSSGNEGYTWRDHKTNEEINEIKVNSILEKKYKL